MYGKHQFSKKLVLAAVLGFVALAPMHALAANKLIVNGTDGVTPKFVVTDKGYIGGGTSAPAVGVQISGTSATDTQIMSQYTNPSVPGGSPVITGGGGFVGYFNYPNNVMPLNGDRLGYFLFGSYDTTGAAKNAAGFSAFAAGDWTSTSTPSEFIFQTTPTGAYGQAGRAERLRISKDGNIAIGFPQTTPATIDYSTFQKLEVNGGVRLNTTTTTPLCDNSHDIRGTFWFTKGGDAGGKDLMEFCATDGTTIAWRKITF